MKFFLIDNVFLNNLSQLVYDYQVKFSQITDVRQINRLRILNSIALKGSTSRAQISRDLGFNKVSTGEIVESLLQEGIIEESGAVQQKAGRPSISISLKKDRYLVIAVDIGLRNIRLALVNLAGELLRFERFPTPQSPTVEEILALIIKTTKSYQMRIAQHQQIIGLSVSIGAQVEAATGTIISHKDWKWENVPFSYALEKYVSIPVIVENNVVAMIRGEQWFSQIVSQKRMFYVNWGEHISGAFLAPGKKISQEALFGHIVVNNSNRCSCGGIGCLETVASGVFLSSHASQGRSVKTLCDEAESDSRKKEILLDSASYIAKALITTSAIVRPEIIVIGGGISLLPEIYMNHLIETFNKQCPPIVNNNIVIERSLLKDRGGIVGTAVVALDELIFKRSLLEQLNQQ